MFCLINSCNFFALYYLQDDNDDENDDDDPDRNLNYYLPVQESPDGQIASFGFELDSNCHSEEDRQTQVLVMIIESKFNISMY